MFELQSILNFVKKLTNVEACKPYFAKIKLQDGFTCSKYGHTKDCQETGYYYQFYGSQQIESAAANSTGQGKSDDLT